MSPAPGPGDASPTHRDGPMAFVADLESPTLDPDDHHHLSRVLRVRDGEPMVVCDGRGSWRTARFAEHPGDLGELRHRPAPSPMLTVAFALIKGDRPELVVQKLTELGLDRIVPFTSAHGVVRWDTRRSARQHERFVRIAREASMQCRRTHLPEVVPPTTFAEVASSVPAPFLADADGVALASAGLGFVAFDLTTHSNGVTVMIGPEGGWSVDEREVGLPMVRLTEHVLRAETASIAAGTLLVSLRSDAVDSAGG